MGLRLALLCAAVVLFVPGAAEAKTKWLCNPDLRSNPCLSSLTATLIGADGKRSVERTRIPRAAPVDCFYVYPTVSGQSTPAADLKIDPEQRAVARAQASRFSPACRIFAPVYRQITLFGLLDPTKVTDEMRATAYEDVRNAFREYLARFNKGRGFVLIGHSQGTAVLRKVIQSEVDKKPATRRKLVSAILLGGNIVVPIGKKVGGDFANVAGCTSPRQTGCVVAYSTFNATPPDDSRFGRPLEGRSKFEVLCTNPAALGGGSGRLVAYGPSALFPGLLGTYEKNTITLPSVKTPWVKYDRAVKARCARAGGRQLPARGSGGVLGSQAHRAARPHLGTPPG